MFETTSRRRWLGLIAMAGLSANVACAPNNSTATNLDGKCLDNTDCVVDYVCGESGACERAPDVPDSGTPSPDAGTPPPDAGTPSDGGTQCTPDTWGNWASGFFVQNCVSCHTNNHSSFRNYSGVSVDATRIRNDITSGNMPRDATLDPSDRSRVLKWLSCGRPQ